MSQFSSGALYRLWLQIQTLLATIPNTSGTWTQTGAKYVPHNKVTIKRIDPLIEAQFKTGTGSMLSGVQGGKRYCTADIEIPLMPSGAAGTVPNSDPGLQGLFGQESTIVASTSVTYSFADGNGIPFIAALFNEASGTNTSQFAYGLVVKSFTLNSGGNGELILTLECVGFYDLETDNFASEDTTGKGGLTVYPTEPSSPAVVGNIIPSFASTITFGGTAVSEFRSMSVKGSNLRDLRMDGIGFYPDPTGVVQPRRKVVISSLTFADSNGAGLIAVKNARFTKTPMDVVVVQGNVAGFIVTQTIKSVQFGDCTFSEDGGGGVNVQFDDSPAHTSAIGNVNDITIAFT